MSRGDSTRQSSTPPEGMGMWVDEEYNLAKRRGRRNRALRNRTTTEDLGKRLGRQGVRGSSSSSSGSDSEGSTSSASSSGPCSKPKQESSGLTAGLTTLPTDASVKQEKQQRKQQLRELRAAARKLRVKKREARKEALEERKIARHARGIAGTTKERKVFEKALRGDFELTGAGRKVKQEAEKRQFEEEMEMKKIEADLKRAVFGNFFLHRANNVSLSELRSSLRDRSGRPTRTFFTKNMEADDGYWSDNALAGKGRALRCARIEGKKSEKRAAAKSAAVSMYGDCDSSMRSSMSVQMDLAPTPSTSTSTSEKQWSTGWFHPVNSEQRRVQLREVPSHVAKGAKVGKCGPRKSSNQIGQMDAAMRRAESKTSAADDEPVDKKFFGGTDCKEKGFVTVKEIGSTRAVRLGDFVEDSGSRISGNEPAVRVEMDSPPVSPKTAKDVADMLDEWVSVPAANAVFSLKGVF